MGGRIKSALLLITLVLVPEPGWNIPLELEPTVNRVYFLRLGVVTAAKKIVRDLELKSFLELKLQFSQEYLMLELEAHYSSCFIEGRNAEHPCCCVPCWLGGI